MNLLTSLIPTESNFELVRKEREFRSQFTGKSQVSSDPVSYWEVSLEFANVPSAQARTLIASLARLRGAGGRFLLFDWSNQSASGTGGQFVVDYFETSLPGLVRIRDVTQGTVVARAGDVVEINGELKLVLNEVVGDSSHKAWIEIEPWLRKPVDGGEVVNFDQAKGVFRLPPNFRIPRPTSKRLVHSTIKITAEEVIE